MAQDDSPRTRRSRRILMEEEILAGAAKVFDEKGVGSSTLQDVADHLAIGRPSLYHYFPSKQALLQRLIDDLIASTENALQRSAIPNEQQASAVERLRQTLVALLKPIAEFPSRFRILMSPEAIQSETAGDAAAMRRVFRDQVQSIIDDGVRNGEFRVVDSRVATYMALGAINWVAWWYHPEMDVDIERLSETLVGLVITGVALPAQEPASASALHSRLTADLARLGSMVTQKD